ncbi:MULTISPECIES: glycine--tRNA ligase subunit beta [Helicobacter]|uniref:Glycine--tRNA ligase beta subunit n=1 Tax=Helicobacter colisuis TaxID=2949739 RepID=A0ABT0TS95_9HELI|nr:MULTISPECIES: glycine--tRNA ligase subunit beta [Helicobacter]MCL9818781.1 glycine--tRNA ligase subunit beta [Helicobacter colisuis]RAX53557.1 glycine--tRNA ligase subunit beta [Helicobacter sp. 11-8110]
MTTTFLLEIGTQELPAIPLLTELPNIKPKFAKILEKYRLLCDFDFFYTPRRLVLIAKQFPITQKSQTLEFFGPPLNIAYKDDEPTQAALGFFKKCGITQQEATTLIKDGKEILYFKKESPQTPAQDLLQTITQEFLESLNFGKSMRWSNHRESFIRPISWILCLLNDTLIPLHLYGINSKSQTFIHRNISFDAKEVASFEDYFQVLQEGKIILKQDQRREKILQEIQAIQAQKGIKVEIDEGLLEEIVSITEYPTALFGEFSEYFLELPPPCIITSMKINQRYFATYKNEKLHNGFVMVSNSLSEKNQIIIEGNVKVLKARLEDALFFYHNDLKNGLNPEKLKEVTFVEGLGTMWDKAQRERQIIKILAPLYQTNFNSQDFGLTLEILDQASSLSKADLMSEMVYEFTDLQGIMGYYYANALGYESNVALAIKEQYLPNSEESPLPSNLISAFVALAYKLDNLLGLFSVKKIPSGSRDPFALRRAAIGIIKIILHFNLPFNLKKIFSLLAPLYRPFDLQQLESFILERLDSMLSFNVSLLRAVLATGERDLLQIYQKLSVLDSILKNQDKTLLTQTFKRVANITKEINLDSNLSIKTDKLLASEEIELYKAFCAYEEKSATLNYQEQLENLLALNPLLSRFFDKVLVNAPDEDFKNNRKNLIAKIYKAFLEIADIKEISF